MLLIIAAIFVGTIFRRSMYLLRGRQLGLRRRKRVKQIVISVYNIVLVLVLILDVWIDQSLYFRASLAQLSYLEAWVCLAIRDYCLAQRIKSAYSCLGPTFVFVMFVD
jgi:hypothetical protein